MDLAELQDVIDRTYGTQDRDRGVPGTVAWLCEEVGELAQALRKGTREQQVHEFADVLAWVATLANLVGVDLSEAVATYADGCPKCASLPCVCANPVSSSRTGGDGMTMPMLSTASPGPAEPNR